MKLERALRGASLCAASREPAQGLVDVKFREGSWYTLRDIERRLEQGTPVEAAIADAAAEVSRRTPAGETWRAYREGAEQALSEARSALGVTVP